MLLLCERAALGASRSILLPPGAHETVIQRRPACATWRSSLSAAIEFPFGSPARARVGLRRRIEQRFPPKDKYRRSIRALHVRAAPMLPDRSPRSTPASFAAAQLPSKARSG